MDQQMEYLIESLRKLKQSGYTCYVIEHDEKLSSTYGFIITPSDNVLYVQANWFGGWSFSFQYKPGSRCGSGCVCLEKPVSEIELEIVEQAEIEGLMFAHKLKAPLYKNSGDRLFQKFLP